MSTKGGARAVAALQIDFDVLPALAAVIERGVAEFDRQGVSFDLRVSATVAEILRLSRVLKQNQGAKGPSTGDVLRGSDSGIPTRGHSSILCSSDVAIEGKCTKRYVTQQAEAGRLKGSKMGRCWRFERSDVDRWLADRADRRDEVSE